jgi:hypothetical protein
MKKCPLPIARVLTCAALFLLFALPQAQAAAVFFGRVRASTGTMTGSVELTSKKVQVERERLIIQGHLKYDFKEIGQVQVRGGLLFTRAILTTRDESSLIRITSFRWNYKEIRQALAPLIDR